MAVIGKLDHNYPPISILVFIFFIEEIFRTKSAAEMMAAFHVTAVIAKYPVADDAPQQPLFLS
jgi:hypothetical protein